MVSELAVEGPNVHTIFARRTTFPNTRLVSSLPLNHENPTNLLRAIVSVLLFGHVAKACQSELQENCWVANLNFQKLPDQIQ